MTNDNKYKNTIYLKNGTQVTNRNAPSLAEQLMNTENWEKGTINLVSEEVTTVVPKHYVATVISELEESNDKL